MFLVQIQGLSFVEDFGYGFSSKMLLQAYAVIDGGNKEHHYLAAHVTWVYRFLVSILYKNFTFYRAWHFTDELAGVLSIDQRL